MQNYKLLLLIIKKNMVQIDSPCHSGTQRPLIHWTTRAYATQYRTLFPSATCVKTAKLLTW